MLGIVYNNVQLRSDFFLTFLENLLWFTEIQKFLRKSNYDIDYLCFTVMFGWLMIMVKNCAELRVGQWLS